MPAVGDKFEAYAGKNEYEEALAKVKEKEVNQTAPTQVGVPTKVSGKQSNDKNDYQNGYYRLS